MKLQRGQKFGGSVRPSWVKKIKKRSSTLQNTNYKIKILQLPQYPGQRSQHPSSQSSSYANLWLPPAKRFT